MDTENLTEATEGLTIYFFLFNHLQVIKHPVSSACVILKRDKHYVFCHAHMNFMLDA